MDESRLWYLGDYETPPPHEAFRPVTLRELADEFSAIEKAGSSEDEVAAARRALVLGSLGQPVYAATQDRRRFYAAGSGPVPQDGLDALAALADARPEARAFLEGLAERTTDRYGPGNRSVPGKGRRVDVFAMGPARDHGDSIANRQGDIAVWATEGEDYADSVLPVHVKARPDVSNPELVSMLRDFIAGIEAGGLRRHRR